MLNVHCGGCFLATARKRSVSTFNVRCGAIIDYNLRPAAQTALKARAAWEGTAGATPCVSATARHHASDKAAQKAHSAAPPMGAAHRPCFTSNRLWDALNREVKTSK